MTRGDRERRATPHHIPTFTTVEKEAEFWDTHSSADFDDELETVTDVRFVKPGTRQVVMVPLESADLGALNERARALGMDPSTLARTWILEHLHGTNGRSRP